MCAAGIYLRLKHRREWVLPLDGGGTTEMTDARATFGLASRSKWLVLPSPHLTDGDVTFILIKVDQERDRGFDLDSRWT